MAADAPASALPAPELPAPELLAPALLDWWEQHGRHDLPWQHNPPGSAGRYRVWVSEVMLQQTQVSTVLRYFPVFIKAFPDVRALADAPADEVLHRWSGLGYYARARNLHRAAQQVRDQHGGQIPDEFDALAGLPGIGRSTAGAILSLADNQRHPILDGNVKRVLARVFGVAGYPGEAAVSRQLWALAERCTPAVRVANYTQAIMDLGASLCARRKPDCAACPLALQCVAYRDGLVEELPTRKAARPRPQKTAVVLLCVRHDGAVLLERRPASGIWGGLWGLPESASVEAAAGWCTATLGVAPERQHVQPVLRHGFTHFELAMTPVEMHVGRVLPERVMEADRWLWYNTGAPARIGLAAPTARLLATLHETTRHETTLQKTALNKRSDRP
ncbi:MAG: A/G-specific adenine glycosylase [Gammaproteobacteria bacterium]